MKSPIYRFKLRDNQGMNHSFEIYSSTEIRSSAGRLGGSSSSNDYHVGADHMARVCSAQHLWELRNFGLGDLVADVRRRRVNLGLATPSATQGKTDK